MKKYSKYIKPYWIFFVLAPLCMVVEVFCDVYIPSLSAEIVNLATENGEVQEVIFTTVQMILLAILSVAGGVGASYFATRASVNFCHDLREDLFEKIQSFSFNNIDKFSTGSLITRLTNDITQLGELVVTCLRMLFRAPGMLIGSIIMAITISPSMSTIFLVLAPILALIVYIVLQISYPRFAKLQDKIDALNVSVWEGLTNIRVIKAFNREKFEEKKFEKVNEDLRDTGLAAYKVSVLQRPLMTLVVNFATIAILWFGSQAVGNNTLEIGDISAFITYLAQILMSVNMIAQIFMQSSRSFVSSKRILEVLEEDVDISSEEAKHPEKVVKSGEVIFKNVDFKYFKNSEDNVLSNINLHIKSGQTVGIIGSTGCGKTSLVHLISRLYDVNSGEILVDGVNVKDYSLENLRNGVSVVLQKNILFQGTVKDNLRWGNQNATDEEIMTAAEYSAAHEFVSEMSDGYDTNLNQGGLNLSGGQKQRLCIARALTKGSKILILDDSTSAVDTSTERKIIKHLTNDLNDITKIIIAQRISSIIHSDFIIVMNDGKITDIGTHSELLEKSDVYKEIYQLQIDNSVSTVSVVEGVQNG